MKRVFSTFVWVLMSISLFAAETGMIRLYNTTIDPAKGAPPVPQAFRETWSKAVPHYYLVHLNRPSDKELQVALEEYGGEIVGYVPDNTYVVYTDFVAALSQLRFIDFVTPYRPDYKIHPLLAGAQAGDGTPVFFNISLHANANVNQAATLVEQAGVTIIETAASPTNKRFEVRADSYAVLNALAEIEAVSWLSPKTERVSRNEKARWILQSYDDQFNVDFSTPIYDQGLHGEDEIIGLIDGQIDIDHCFFYDNIDPGPNHRKIVYFDSSTSNSTHGTHVAGSLAGFPENGFVPQVGLAYMARIAFTYQLSNQSQQLYNVLSNHAAAGAFIHSNSWGEIDRAGATDYTVDATDVDAFSYENEDHLVIFATMNGSKGSTPLLSPENAVNVLAVGATELRQDWVNYWAGAERHGSGRMGPTIVDGRRKPEIMAPGCNVVSSVPNATPNACAYDDKCGTSMATPLVSASAALVRQYFREGFYPTGVRTPANLYIPSGALIKAVLLNGTLNMTNESLPGDLPIPNDIEGWGRLNLDNALYFSGEDKRLIVQDVRNGEGLSTGEESVHHVFVENSGDPLRVTMVFTAPPGTPGTESPVVNDLNLVVTAPNGTSYRGNVWSNGASVSGGFFDTINNVEQVKINNPPTGYYRIEVRAKAVNLDTQGYALAISGRIGNQDSVYAGKDVSSCYGESIQLQASTNLLQGFTVSWSPDDNMINADTLTPTVTVSGPTTFTVSLTTANGTIFDDLSVDVLSTDFNDDQVVDADDLQFFIDGDFWNREGTDIFDVNNDGFYNVLDLVQVMNCFMPSE